MIYRVIELDLNQCHKPIEKVNERNDVHGNFRRTVPVEGHAEGQLQFWSIYGIEQKLFKLHR